MKTISILLTGLLLAGTLGWAQEPFSPMTLLALPLPPGERAIARMLQQPDGNVYGLVPTGDRQWRYLRIGPTADGKAVIIDAIPDLVMPPAALLPTADLAWQWDAARKQGYVLTQAGRLVLYRADGATTDLGQVAGTRPFEEETHGYQISRALVLTPAGEVYTAGGNGVIYRYTPEEKGVTKLDARLPAIAGRESYASLDTAVIGPDGLIYGGTYDGYLFTFDPKTGIVLNYGKPFRAQHIPVLIFREGKLYGIGGGAQDFSRVFSFDPATRSFTLGGMFTRAAKLHNYYEPVRACAADAAGNIYISTTGRLGDLYLWAKERPAAVK